MSFLRLALNLVTSVIYQLVSFCRLNVSLLEDVICRTHWEIILLFCLLVRIESVESQFTNQESDIKLKDEKLDTLQKR